MCLGITAALAQSQWTTSYEEAAKVSDATNRPIFAFFTGSDWCPFCQKLTRQVLNTPQFLRWASNNVVLLEVDFPKRTELAPELKKQNYDLKAKYKVKGYPTVLMLTSDGREVARQVGFPKDTVAVQWVDDLIAKVNDWLAKNGKSTGGQ